MAGYIDDYAGLDAKGKLVLVRRFTPTTGPCEGPRCSAATATTAVVVREDREVKLPVTFGEGRGR